MYNCARLATLFEGYKHGVDQGLYPTFPLVSSLDFSLLHDEVSVRPDKQPQAEGLGLSSQHSCLLQGEWLLLFNSVLPFLDLLSQTVSLASTPGLHIPARTEMVRHRRHYTHYSLFWVVTQDKTTAQRFNVSRCAGS